MFVIVERNAHVVEGHQHTQLSAIQAMVLNTKIELLQATGGIASSSAVLSPDADVRKRPDASLQNDIAAVARYLRSLDEDHVTVIIPNANAYEIRQVFALLDAKKVVRFLLRLLRPEDIGALETDELNTLRQAIRSAKISLHTEASELTKYLKEAHGVDAEDNFLLPCSLNPGNFAEPKTRDLSGPFRVGFLGVPRKEKGRKQVPTIMQNVAKLLTQNDRPIQFVLQRRPSRRRYSPAFYEMSCNRSVKRSDKVSISWQDKSLSDDAFCALLGKLDLLLLPYQVTSYAHRGSGMIIDGVLAGVPMLHTRGMAMADLLSFTGTAAEGADEFARQIVRLSRSEVSEAANVAAARERITVQLDRTRALLAGAASEVETEAHAND